MTGAQRRQGGRLARRRAAGGWRQVAGALLDDLETRVEPDRDVLGIVVALLTLPGTGATGSGRWVLAHGVSARLGATAELVLRDARTALAREAAALRAAHAEHLDA